jgi:hypothetical protein
LDSTDVINYLHLEKITNCSANHIMTTKAHICR